MTKLLKSRTSRILVALLGTLIFSGLFPLGVHADEVPVEIDYLLTEIGHSDCTFIRNGSRYDAADAEAHLRMKYSRGKRYVSTTEQFIERLASQSSLSKKPYHIECGDDGQIASGQWLMQRLKEYRAKQNEIGSKNPDSDRTIS